MTRWTAAALLVLAAGTALVARADDLRSFPDAALRGRLLVANPPAVVLDGQDAQLSIGARIRDRRNLFVTSGTLADGQQHLVNYLVNGTGQISEVWVLTPEEAAIRRAGANPSFLERWFGL